MVKQLENHYYPLVYFITIVTSRDNSMKACLLPLCTIYFIRLTWWHVSNISLLLSMLTMSVWNIPGLKSGFRSRNTNVCDSGMLEFRILRIPKFSYRTSKLRIPKFNYQTSKLHLFELKCTGVV